MLKFIETTPLYLGGKRCLMDPSEKFQRDPVQRPVALLQMSVFVKMREHIQERSWCLGARKQGQKDNNNKKHRLLTFENIHMLVN